MQEGCSIQVFSFSYLLPFIHLFFFKILALSSSFVFVLLDELHAGMLLNAALVKV
jgi:hypothetical protein